MDNACLIVRGRNRLWGDKTMVLNLGVKKIGNLVCLVKKKVIVRKEEMKR